MLLERGIILDHAVVNENKFSVATRVRMGVVFGNAAVRRPTGVPDTDMPAQRNFRRALCQLRNPPDGTHRLKRMRLIPDRQSRRIVAAVLHAGQTFQKDRQCLFFPDVADDAAHNFQRKVTLPCRNPKKL